MRTRIKIITLFCFIAIGQVFGQVRYSVCDIYTINSQNDNFFLRTVPFDNIDQSPLGKTIVFNSDSTKIYEIPRKFENRPKHREIFLSNDGNTIVYVIDREFRWNGVQNKSIEIFKNGVPFKQYQLTDLINCDSDNEDCYLFYNEAIDEIALKLTNPWTKEEILVTKAIQDTINWSNKTAWTRTQEIIYKEGTTNFEKELTKKATFLNNDTLYIFTKTNQLLKIDLNTADLSVLSIENVNEEWFRQIKPFEIKSENFKSAYDLPNLSNGKPLETGLAEYLNMVVFPEFKRNSDRYKRHSMQIEILVDKSGNAILDKTIYGRGDLSEEKVKTFIETQRFDTSKIPAKTEMWRFSGWVTFMNKSKKEAKKERQTEILEEREAYKKRIVADSINGLYIPQNLEECFVELNKILKPKDIETIKNLKDKNETILYHHGFGTWLRNNWGLWGGSRLQQYLIKKGLRHPDDMSATILQFYYDWLNGENDEWRKFEEK